MLKGGDEMGVGLWEDGGGVKSTPEKMGDEKRK